jgi:hypothetical protein
MYLRPLLDLTLTQTYDYFCSVRKEVCNTLGLILDVDTNNAVRSGHSYFNRAGPK